MPSQIFRPRITFRFLVSFLFNCRYLVDVISFFILLKHWALFPQTLCDPAMLWTYVLFTERHQPPHLPGNGAKLSDVWKHNTSDSNNIVKRNITLAIKVFGCFQLIYFDVLFLLWKDSFHFVLCSCVWILCCCQGFFFPFFLLCFTPFMCSPCSKELFHLKEQVTNVITVLGLLHEVQV